MGYVVEMREISKQFPAVLANNRVSLCVESGTIHAIIGENGAGKTTLLRMICSLLPSGEGQAVDDFAYRADQGRYRFHTFSRLTDRSAPSQ